MSHHEVTGRPFAAPWALGTGLAGGLLAELMLGAGIVLRPDGAVLPGRTWAGDSLAQHVRDLVAAEREPYPVRDWLVFLSRTAAADVAERLGQAGYVRRADRRVPWRAVRWVPVDPDWAFAALLRVRPGPDPAQGCPAHGVILAGLAAACGLGFRLARSALPPGRVLDQALRQLDPPLRELISQTEASVGNAVLSRRM